MLGLIRLQGPLGPLLGFDRAQGKPTLSLDPSTQTQSRPDDEDEDDFTLTWPLVHPLGTVGGSPGFDVRRKKNQQCFASLAPPFVPSSRA